ncbi:putative LRR receptor-like serine/threonine-protein kinase RLK [Apostasia shenzhenica]|uniref:non-specific serine/threonine protein kinase n=1 Tax=Apostasia shenzhenica TaxID=1088818 RepID=A0A2I0AH62_9ASPA|nr:putative LRR receptor-like serine/threonine-protein kinase RLK [Apostasia shenzhenica]
MARPPAPWPPLLLLLLLTVGPATTASAPLGAEEGEALLRFKATLSGLGADLPSWIPGARPCNVNSTTWDGVICFNGHVWGVQLEDLGLAGRLDLSPLAALSGLRTISFMRNEFEGPFPDVGHLGALKAIYLSGNRFSGEIPGDTFADMRSLKKLFVSDNGFSGEIPASLAGLGKLLELRLDHNKFAGGIPEFSQPGLETVDVAFNDLEGPIPQRLSKMDPKFFQGNAKLCGPPLAAACYAVGQPAAKKSTTLSGRWLPFLLLAILLLLLLLLLIVTILLHRRRNRRHDSLAAVRHPPPAKKTARILDADKLELGASAGPHHHHHHRSSSGAASGGSAGGRRGGREGGDGGHGRLAFVREGRERFELHDLLRASAEVLGSGNFGSSYKAVLSAGPTVVVKRFKEMNGVGKEEFSEHMRRMGRLSHPNVLPLVAYYYKKEEKLLVTDFVPNGSLAHMLHGNRGSTLPPLDWPTRLKIVKGVARGLAYLYDELPVLILPHGHLKSSNVLLGETFAPLLADYALVPVMNAAHASQVMVAYKSPEVHLLGRPSRKSDVWSLGILILEILTGKFPANFLHKGAGAGTDLAVWVSNVVQGEWSSEVFDGDIRETESGELGEMHELLKIGLDCCEESVEKRLEMRDALERIEQLKERQDDKDEVLLS